MRLKPLKKFSIIWSLLFFFSCLTINIYFPEAAVKKTADEIVDEIRKSEEEEKEKKESASQENEVRQMIFDQGSSFSFIPTAYAQEEVEKVSSPKIRALKQSLKERFPKIRPFFDKGSIGETNDGLIQVRDESGLNLREKSLLRNIVKDENNDRKNLYAEVAQALGVDPSQIDRVNKIFAERWISKASPGWWTQNKEGQWIRKK